MIYFLDFKASYTIYMIQNESRVSKLCSWSFKTMWGGNYPTLLETQNFMTPCYFGAPKKKRYASVSLFLYNSESGYSLFRLPDVLYLSPTHPFRPFPLISDIAAAFSGSLILLRSAEPSFIILSYDPRWIAAPPDHRHPRRLLTDPLLLRCFRSYDLAYFLYTSETAREALCYKLFLCSSIS